MRFLSIIICVLLYSNCLSAQENLENVKWTIELDKDKSELRIEASMKEDWILFSQHTDPKGGLPLDFDFVELKCTKLIGEVEELSTPTVVMSEYFGVELTRFHNQARFKQKIELTDDTGNLTCHVTYLTCNSKRCLPVVTIPLEVNF